MLYSFIYIQKGDGPSQKSLLAPSCLVPSYPLNTGIYSFALCYHGFIHCCNFTEGLVLRWVRALGCMQHLALRLLPDLVRISALPLGAPLTAVWHTGYWTFGLWPGFAFLMANIAGLHFDLVLELHTI